MLKKFEGFIKRRCVLLSSIASSQVPKIEKVDANFTPNPQKVMLDLYLPRCMKLVRRLTSFRSFVLISHELASRCIILHSKTPYRVDSQN